jgi:putative tryptophan/tyrosine transport system substrate-binding protein
MKIVRSQRSVISNGAVFIAVIALLFAFRLSAHAQQEAAKIPRIGYLASFGSPDASPGKHQLIAFRQGLRDLGYIEGKTIRLDYRYPKDNPEQAPELAADLVRQKVDILIAVDSSAIRAAKQATKTVPIIMITNQDPVAAGFVDSLAVPGANVTGITRLTRELSGKRLELLKELVPSGSRVAVLWVRPTALGTGTGFKNYENAAPLLKLQLHSSPVQRPHPDLDGAFEAAVKARANALVIVSNAVLRPHAREIANLALKNRLASICEASQYVDAGCLMSYATDDRDSYRRVAIYVDKILKGAKPAELPIEQPTKFELVINLKTAKQIGLEIPPQVLARADKVIK